MGFPELLRHVAAEALEAGHIRPGELRSRLWARLLCSELYHEDPGGDLPTAARRLLEETLEGLSIDNAVREQLEGGPSGAEEQD